MNSSTPSNNSPRRRKSTLTIKEITVFAMLAALMLCSKKVMEGLPNIHLVGMLTITYTVVYRSKALIPLYLYVFLDGLFLGFNTAWVPYLYIWTILWGLTMLLPKKMPKGVACVVYPVLCMLHGLAFGILYAPAQALLFHLNFEQTVAWVIAGFTFDIIHAIGNFAVGLLIYPMVMLLKKLEKRV